MSDVQPIAASVAQGIRSVPGVVGIYSPRPAVLEAARTAAAAVAGAVLGVPEPTTEVVVDIRDDVAVVRVDIAADARHRAGEIARAVAADVRSRFAAEAPGLPVEVTVRIASLDS
ncbi:hypothetical protein MN032_06110 [Agromyces atrinae]|jgi:hypothetical protein|uniref:Uncharacterized protein n=1 Tax=Agromyces atrinae TaxID=592376 RepID=A0A4Q2M4H6_9MICO|nr:hypothetical protein [Agromyces atrinae]MCI2957260.1 hypothetical protein [Agromyces atrinae]NYD67388.1 hypothetical protein [Agromyces atrinae]RXZ86789.1 hypothetical protein ESP50_06900 [Agromyces atrinae]